MEKTDMEELSSERGKTSSLFFERLPPRPYCSNGKGERMLVRTKAHAATRPLIQYNKPTTLTWLCFDVDRTRAREASYDANLPTPSLIVENRENEHCHVYYGLITPVHKTSAARLKPLKFLAAVEEGLRVKLGADEGFAGLIGKTPHHEKWRTLEPVFECLYELGELAEYVKLPAKLPRRLGIRTGLGRNVELFDRLRFWGYKWKAEYVALKKSKEHWMAAVMSQAVAYNDFAVPLPLSEVKATAKSVAKWTWQNYTGRMSDADFSALQSKRKRKTTIAKVEAENGRD
jgi:Replicase family/Primase C terminal 1 (PriCT-1)